MSQESADQSEFEKQTSKFKAERLQEFRAQSHKLKYSGLLYCHQLKDIQETLQSRELIDACRHFGKTSTPADSQKPVTAVDDPLDGHRISAEFRTKMTDWMIEVCSSFKCQPRTYYLTVTIMDKFLQANKRHGIVLENKDIHLIGVTALYLASKYEDVVPLHSKVVSEKIAHGAISPSQITQKELEFLRMLDFQLDLATPFDFWQTYTDKLEKQMMFNLKSRPDLAISEDRASHLLGKLSEMTQLLMKMSVQCRDFLAYSPSALVASALYASTAFLKHSKSYSSDETSAFITEVRAVLFQLIAEERHQ